MPDRWLQTSRRSLAWEFFWVAGAIVCLALTRKVSFVLFHSLAEMTNIVVAACLFVIAWNAKDLVKNSYLLILGVAYLCSGFLNLLHLLAYKGMEIVPGAGSDLPTQLWMATRFMQSISLMGAPFFIKRRINPNVLLGGYCLVTAALVGLIVFGYFPRCYIEGEGLTDFKIHGEYVIIGFLGVAIWQLRRVRNEFDIHIYQWLVASIAVSCTAEACFIGYVGVYDNINMLGHCLNLLSCYLLYKGIVEAAYKRPYAALFRDLKRSEDDLKRNNEDLEKRVQERAEEIRVLAGRIINIQEEERRALARELHDDLTQRLAALSIEAGQLLRNPDALSSRAKIGLQSLQGELARLSDGIHAISRQLHPSILEDLGLPDALRSECDAFTKREGIRVQYKSLGSCDDLSREVALSIFRVAQQALHNVAQHADASQVQIFLEAAPDTVSLTVVDNGVGFDMEERQRSLGIGLSSMLERTRLVRGTLNIQSKPFAGTTVSMSVPRGRDDDE